MGGLWQTKKLIAHTNVLILHHENSGIDGVNDFVSRLFSLLPHCCRGSFLLYLTVFLERDSYNLVEITQPDMKFSFASIISGSTGAARPQHIVCLLHSIAKK
jgi:hypothetical protein